MNSIAKLDVRGSICPEPVMMLHKKMRELSVGAVVEITCTDPSTQRDIPKFCHYLKHSLLAAHQDDELFIYQIRKDH